MQELKVAVVGLDTSHCVELPRLMNSPECKPELKISGLKVVACNRFMTRFTNNEVLDKRQAQLEQWGIKVTENFDEAIADCDAIMMEINDPALHLEYFEKLAALGKPVFLDKPLAESVADGRKIVELARKHGTRVWSGSSIPFNPKVCQCINNLQDEPLIAHTFGPMGQAPAGSSLIWYGVHTFELMQRLIGPCGAKTVHAVPTPIGVVSSVVYADGRVGVVECQKGCWCYGGRIQHNDNASLLHILASEPNYYYMMRNIRSFFRGGEAPITMERTFEGLAIMNAAEESVKTGKPVEVEQL